MRHIGLARFRGAFPCVVISKDHKTETALQNLFVGAESIKTAFGIAKEGFVVVRQCSYIHRWRGTWQVGLMVRCWMLLILFLIAPIARGTEVQSTSPLQYIASLPVSAVIGFGTGQAIQGRFIAGPECSLDCTGSTFALIDTGIFAGVAGLFLWGRSADDETRHSLAMPGLLLYLSLIGSRIAQLGEAMFIPPARWLHASKVTTSLARGQDFQDDGPSSLVVEWTLVIH